ncbi:sigma-70 family RNA polymerase sigma factor [Tissierella pigra]|uniref:Sigma-70 family RNA polymerase sigma factor n=1 Tax=Tissierella pigra TaxID=2607614 RepID=A0A6N7Y0K8_9FIRM|nr:sigma-70 family RNA polymerase sigma factor [Tissierella pigra]MBU5426903.1 sigma-70 family RNA polymerase sigma factor [Tissierella pigra]MSU03283.1 sigma-70 family RNA polymerase sigma factor [Tissierella pigra]
MGRKILTEEHFNSLIDEYGTEILRLCYLYLKDYQLAEDACQDTFLKVYKSFHSFNGLSTEKTWITKICINTCKNYLRNPWKRKVTLENKEFIQEEVSDKEIFAELEKSELFNSIMNLRKKYKEIILMYYYQQLSVNEISQILDISESNAFTRLSRARQLLKDELGGIIYE